MPRVDIWIRKEDWQKWQSIKDKPEWLHEHLNRDFNPVMVIDSSKLVMPTKPNLAPIEPKLTPPEESA